MTKKPKRPKLPRRCGVLALDPGNTTGWVLVEYFHDEVDPGYLLHRWGVFNSIDLEISAAPLMYKLANVVVTESYVIRPDTFSANVGKSPYALEVIGRARLWARQFEVPIFHQQPPAQAKQQWTDSRLKKHFQHHVLYPSGAPGASHPEPGLCRHEVDALRHAMTYLENAYGVALVMSDEEDLI